MPTEHDIQMEKERLYESSSLRDDLPDEPATELLKWGEGQVERLAQDYPDDFEKKARFLRQVIKNTNRFVGQREFNDADGQANYMKKVAMYLPELGWDDTSQDDLMAALPDDATDLMGNLKAILHTLTPPNLTTASGDTLTAGDDFSQQPPPSTPSTPPAAPSTPPPTPSTPPSTPENITEPSVDDVGQAIGSFVSNLAGQIRDAAAQNAQNAPLENTNDSGDNQDNVSDNANDEGISFDD